MTALMSNATDWQFRSSATSLHLTTLVKHKLETADHVKITQRRHLLYANKTISVQWESRKKSPDIITGHCHPSYTDETGCRNFM